MKRLCVITIICALVALPALAGPPAKCTKIQSGSILDSAGDVVTTGFDQWGYNYQAGLFSGDYCDAYRGASWCQPYVGISLQMNWNDVWLSNQDCDDDGALDRHHGFPSYQGSGAWLTNHMSGTNPDGSVWTYFVKIVAAPADAFVCGSNWCTGDGDVIGQRIWNEFAIIQEVLNDPSTGTHGVQQLSPVAAGLGRW